MSEPPKNPKLLKITLTVFALVTISEPNFKDEKILKFLHNFYIQFLF